MDVGVTDNFLLDDEEYFVNISRSKNDILYISHASYEPRCLAVTKETIPAQVKCGIIFYSKELRGVPSYKLNIEELEKHFKNHNVAVYFLEVKELHNLDMLRDLVALLQDFLIDECDFFIDISTFPNDRMVCLVDYLSRVDHKIIIKHVKPLQFSPDIKENGWLTRGVHRVVPVLRFNGRQNTTKETLLVTVVDWNIERVKITINQQEPDKLIFFTIQEIEQKVETSFEDDIFNNTLKNLFLDNDFKTLNRFSVDLHNLNSIVDQLTTVIEAYSSLYNICFTLNSSKVYSLATLLVCQKYPRVRILYSQPECYNMDSYSMGIGNMSTIYIASSCAC